MSEQDCVPYALVLGENHLVLGEPAILGGWCGTATTSFMRGTWRPPSLEEKLLGGTKDQGDRRLGVLGRDLVAEKQYSL